MATLTSLFRGLKQKSSLVSSARQLTCLIRGVPVQTAARGTQAVLCQKSWLTSHVHSKNCSCGVHKLTKGESDLLSFVASEIDYEASNPPDTEKPAGFTSSLDGTHVTLTRLYPGEEVMVEFDIDQNTNQDEASLEEEQEEDRDLPGKIVSYPSFSVKIIKESGRTLMFQCEYDVDEVSPEEGIDMFHFNYICVLPTSQTDPYKNVYHCETENMDPDMYDLLRTMLQERGINNEFAQSLLDYSTGLEQQHYLVFLNELKSFVNS